MNHFVALLLLSLAVAIVFTLISRDETRERTRYFLTLIGYMVGGSLLAAWLMSWLG